MVSFCVRPVDFLVFSEEFLPFLECRGFLRIGGTVAFHPRPSFAVFDRDSENVILVGEFAQDCYAEFRDFAEKQAIMNDVFDVSDEAAKALADLFPLEEDSEMKRLMEKTIHELESEFT
jgi:hypothetical protein